MDSSVNVEHQKIEIRDANFFYKIILFLLLQNNAILAPIISYNINFVGSIFSYLEKKK